jgi:hypothetical protein
MLQFIKALITEINLIKKNSCMIEIQRRKFLSLIIDEIYAADLKRDELQFP